MKTLMILNVSDTPAAVERLEAAADVAFGGDGLLRRCWGTYFFDVPEHIPLEDAIERFRRQGVSAELSSTQNR